MPGYSFEARGIEPKEVTFRHATEDVHRLYWKYIAAAGQGVYARQIAAGIDAHGVQFTALKPHTIEHRKSAMGPADPHGPVFEPAHESSRIISLLRARAFSDHAEFYWATDPISGIHWGLVMHGHQIGYGHLPERDAIGFAPASLRELTDLGYTWWRSFQRGVVIAYHAKRAELSTESANRLERAHPPIKFELTGRTDVEYMTHGAGHGSLERSRRAIAEGYSTGFRDVGGYTGPHAVAIPPGAGKPPQPAPKPATAPKAPWVHPARVVPRREPAPKRSAARAGEAIPPRPAQPAPIDVGHFARQVKATVASVGSEGRFFDKVFISHAHVAYVKTHGPMSIDQFKALLVTAVQGRHLDLSRADLVEAMNLLDLRASLTVHPGGAEYHFIRG